MKEINWPKITADLIKINQMPECQKKKSGINEILTLLYLSDFDPYSNPGPFMTRILDKFKSFCSGKIKITPTQASELLQYCPGTIYENLSKYDPESSNEDDRILEKFLIKQCLIEMLKQYKLDHPDKKTLSLDRPIDNDDNGRTGFIDITPDIKAMTPEDIAVGLHTNQELIDRRFPDDLYSREEQMLVSLIILLIGSEKDLSRWTKGKLKTNNGLYDGLELYKTAEEKEMLLIYTLDSIMQSIINGNDHSISESGLMQFLCHELPTAQNTYCSDQGENTVYTKNYISCCVSRIYRKWKQTLPFNSRIAH